MDIEDSASVPYRAFLRSGSYPALSRRVVRSGGVLVKAAGWFALVVTAASAGYNMTQRLVTPSAAAPSAPARVRVLATAPELHRTQPSETPVPVEELAARDGIATAEPSAPRASVIGAAATGKPLSAAAAPSGARKRAGALAIAEPERLAAALADGAPSSAEPAHAEQIAERVRALDEVQPPPAAAADSGGALLSEVLGGGAPRAVAEPVRAEPAVSRNPVAGTRAVATKAPASLPLKAAAKVDGLVVRGPLSAAHVRRSIERVRPTLSECYSDAAQRAGHNRYSQVRVVVTIDEAGRVKTSPKVEGAQLLPGFGTCLSSAFSKLVCQAPDTGTAKASILLAFEPPR